MVGSRFVCRAAQYFHLGCIYCADFFSGDDFPLSAPCQCPPTSSFSATDLCQWPHSTTPHRIYSMLQLASYFGSVVSITSLLTERMCHRPLSYPLIILSEIICLHLTVKVRHITSRSSILSKTPSFKSTSSPSPFTRHMGPLSQSVRNLNLHEHQSMDLFQKYGVDTPKYVVATSPSEAEKKAVELRTYTARMHIVTRTYPHSCEFI